MHFPQSRGQGRPGTQPGTVDYRLDRRRLLCAVRAGEVDLEEVCDAQIELLRVGKDYSKAAPTPCPVCSVRKLRHVRFVFGPRLPKEGRAINSTRELQRLAEKAGDYRCYLVEVCMSCRWNHLLSASPLSSRATA